ncbi:MAG: preprotein translocase subunit YajC [Candidatus Brocadiae bacterium]|nr:preprotein translocase subunit YajC [Candidatus Brocadiia bacterium]
MAGLHNAAFVLAAETGGQAAAAPAQGQPGGFGQGLIGLLPIVAILVLFFWFMSRSQKKRDKKRRDMLDSVRTKDDVLTIGGIHGRVVQMKDDEVVLRIDPEKDIKITVAKNCISRRLGEEEPE